MIKIMTYNIMSGNDFVKIMEGKAFNDQSVVNPINAAEVIKKQNAEIVVLNEVRGDKGGFTNQTKEIAEYCGYEFYYFAEALSASDISYGNAVLSKYPIIFSETILVETTEADAEMAETRSIAHITVDADGKKLDVIGTHFGLLDSEKKDMVDKIVTLCGISDNPIVLMGDFNCMPSSDYSKKLREYMNDTMLEYGDDYTTYFGPSMPHSIKKIDYIYTSNNIKVFDAKVVTETASDHFPCVAMIEI